MTNVVTLQNRKESRVTNLLNDERGLTMVELLATVVILAIIMGIGALAIGGVIQRSREDAGVAEVKNVYEAGKLYVASNTGTSVGTSFNLATIMTAGMYESTAITATDAANVKYNVNDDGSLTLEFPAILEAGSKTNTAFGTAATPKTAQEVKSLDRTILFP